MYPVLPSYIEKHRLGSRPKTTSVGQTLNEPSKLQASAVQSWMDKKIRTYG